ncbi:succinate dehydrogenase/fumarate reductase iron-sulfur subunit [Candidatus Acetothermia bacterium]|nr:succinate dehydrogenase/fumarate reductase iron-sulfur subunit [Candidatus Acetothermia bacterium]MBI3660086.1 succinate dehydrogenase/fumarate reductase iron-sulfur subunit [Candidatus Acetothermia bacterium]
MAEIALKIFRGDASGGAEKEYRVEATPGMVVLDAVLRVQATQASDLAVRWNCKAAHCGSCSAEVNGKPRLMCKTRTDEFQGKEIHVGPMRAFKLIKDLVTDVSFNYKTARMIPAFTPPAGEKAPFTMYEKDVERLYEYHKCIECFLCQNVCHVIRDHKAPFFGPRQLVRIASLEMHPKDTLDRAQFLKDTALIGYCNITKCCTEVCPEHIHITDNAIIPLKERVVDEFYDPVQWIWRKIMGRNSNGG